MCHESSMNSNTSMQPFIQIENCLHSKLFISSSKANDGYAAGQRFWFLFGLQSTVFLFVLFCFFFNRNPLH